MSRRASFVGRASSGNIAEVSLVGEADGQIVVDVSWNTTPSDEDTEECNNFMRRLIQPKEMHTMYVPDAAERKALGRMILDKDGMAH